MDGAVTRGHPEVKPIYGTLSVKGTLTGSLSSLATLSGTLTIPAVVDYDPYQGEYTVTPRVYTQVLATRGKHMQDDVTVNEIPVTRTSNPQGGQTVLIG